MSDDRPRRPPPRFPRPVDDEPEVTRVEEDPFPLTERLPMLPPPPKAPEPFKLIAGRPPSYVEFQAQLGEFTQKLEAVISSQAAVLGVQRKMALQLDGFGTTVNERFDVFHQELALLRATVTGDHAPRLDKVEKTVADKAKTVAIAGTKYGSYFVAVAFVARMAAKAYPQFGSVIEDLLSAVGL